MASATAAAAQAFQARHALSSLPFDTALTIQHSTPIIMIATPITLSTSTRSRSVQGAHGWPRHIFLQAKQQTEGKNLGAAANGDRGRLAGRDCREQRPAVA